jgi:hypothetical protein
MSCDRIRPLLPAVAYGNLEPDQAELAQAHLAACADCRRELASLERVRALLNTLPTPPAQLNLAQVYHAAAQRQVRRWQRWAFVAGAAAAAVLVGLLVMKLEVRAEQHQLVLRWGAEPVVPVPAPSSGADQPSVVPAASTADVKERLDLLNEFVLALARDVESRGTEHQEEVALLKAHLALLERRANLRLAATERDVDALYTVQFNSPDKGADR